MDDRREYVRSVAVKRWDLAVDVPYGRDCVQLIKDSRKYSQFYNSSVNFTEYLGRPSSEGYVKVYNKQLEAELEYPLTRIELTCGSLEYRDCMIHWPQVYMRSVIDLAETKIMVQLLAAQPVESMDFYLRQMSAPTKRRYKALLLERPFEVSPGNFAKVVDGLKDYEVNNALA